MSFHDSAPDSSGEWKSRIDIRHPCWDGYRGLIEALPAEDFPGARALTRLLPPGTRSPKIPGTICSTHWSGAACRG
jgi:hypothetical protein